MYNLLSQSFCGNHVFYFVHLQISCVYFCLLHAVIYLICCFTYVCRSKSPTGLMFNCLLYSTKNKNSMSMSNICIGKNKANIQLNPAFPSFKFYQYILDTFTRVYMDLLIWWYPKRRHISWTLARITCKTPSSATEWQMFFTTNLLKWCHIGIRISYQACDCCAYE